MKLTNSLYFYPESGPMDCNTYVIKDETTILIDPGLIDYLSNLLSAMHNDGIDEGDIDIIRIEVDLVLRPFVFLPPVRAHPVAAGRDIGHRAASAFESVGVGDQRNGVGRSRLDMPIIDEAEFVVFETIKPGYRHALEIIVAVGALKKSA